VLDSILTCVKEVIPYFMASVLLPDSAAENLVIVGSAGYDAEERRRSIKVPLGKGITGHAFKTGQPLNVSDVLNFPGYITSSSEVRSEMVVPFKRGDTVIGVIDVERKELGAFDDHELNILVLFGSQAAIAIENARLYSNQRARVLELQAIQSIVQKLTLLHDVPSIALLIEHELKNLIDYHACRLFLLEPERQALRLVLLDPGLRDVTLKNGEGIAGWIAQHNESVLIPNVLEDDRGWHIPGTPVREESMIGASLEYEGKVRGVISLTKLGADQFDENSLRLLEIIAAQTAIALDRARLYDELRTQAITDELTDLYNRRYLLERFKEERSRAIRNKHTLAAMMVDIDKFKVVNDTYGHDAGDVVLQELATVVRAVVRTEDIVARHGGEEFCLLLPDIPPGEAERVAQRIRSSIESQRLPPEAGVSRITVSVGMALMGPDDTAHEVFTRADQAMYHVKHGNGNQVCVYENGRMRLLPVLTYTVD